MIDLEKTAAGVSLRVWVLIANLAANILLVHGGAHYFVRGTHLGELIVGAVITSICIALLSIPNR